MSSVAAQSISVRRESVRPNASATVRVRIGSRRRALVGRRLAYLLIAGALLLVFVHVSLYAMMTAISFERDKLSNQYRLEKIENERLRVEYVRRTSPAYVIAWAQSAGMVYSKDFEYLERSKTVASAAGDR